MSGQPPNGQFPGGVIVPGGAAFDREVPAA